MRNDREYQICKAISTYLKFQYPNVIFHFDYAGLHLTKAQAGKMKEIQGGKGWPDLFIAEPKHNYHGLFLEIKKENERLYKKVSRIPITEHIQYQINQIITLNKKNYCACFAIGFDEAKKIIDGYLG